MSVEPVWSVITHMQLLERGLKNNKNSLLLGIRWYDRVTNTDVYARTGQHPLTTTIRKRRLGAFGHIPPGTQGIDILSS